MDDDVKIRVRPEDVPYGVIYVVTNKAECDSCGKQYVGQTTKADPWTRWDQHIRDAYITESSMYNTKFDRAIRKFGWENFEFQVIDTAFDEDDLDNKESIWIKKLNTFHNGYNSYQGGKSRHTITKEKELEVVVIYEKLKRVDETSLVIGISVKTVSGILEKYGYSKVNKIDNGHDIFRIPVVYFNLTTGERFYARSISDAAEDLLIKTKFAFASADYISSNIRQQLAGWAEEVHGYRFYYVNQEDSHADWLKSKELWNLMYDPPLIVIDMNGIEFWRNCQADAAQFIAEAYYGLDVNSDQKSTVLRDIKAHIQSGKHSHVRGFKIRYAVDGDKERLASIPYVAPVIPKGCCGKKEALTAFPVDGGDAQRYDSIDDATNFLFENGMGTNREKIRNHLVRHLKGEYSMCYRHRFYLEDGAVEQHENWLAMKDLCKPREEPLIMTDKFGVESYSFCIAEVVIIIENTQSVILTQAQKNGVKRVLKDILSNGSASRWKNVRGFAPRYATPEDIARHEARSTDGWKYVRTKLDTFTIDQLDILTIAFQPPFNTWFSKEAKLDILADMVIQRAEQKESVSQSPQ